MPDQLLGVPEGGSARSARFSASLGLGLRVLECFDAGRPVLGVAEIAELIGSSRSTVHRYLVTLKELGFVEQVHRRRYRLTLGVTRLGCSALCATDLGVLARPAMQRLAGQTGFAVDLAVLDGPDVMLVVQVSGLRGPSALGEMEGVREPVGECVPSYCTAVGKVLYATLPARERREALSGLVLKRRARGTITSRRGLRRELAAVAESGIALEDEELVDGRVGVAAGVREGQGVVCAALGVWRAGLQVGVERLAERSHALLLSAADEISGWLGSRYPRAWAPEGISA